MDVYEDEERELISNDDVEYQDFYNYCDFSKTLYNSTKECRCKYAGIFACCLPFAVVVDAVVLVPQMLVNNYKLCIM